ncbi:MAG: MFS transporter [Candidatus Dormibacteraeota bacterium]|nr:MFS transporter [Candidatus Dormibacteraeota bacterium]MDQ6899668.1 MFS transporter [Candidatus Dormibacteraeota bacterium]
MTTASPVSRPSIARTVRDLSLPVWTLLGGTLVNRLGSFLQMYLVLYLVHRGYAVAVAALALGAYGVGTIAGVLAGGALTDRLGYRWTIAGSMVMAALLTVALTLAPGPEAIVVVAAGIGAAAEAGRPASSVLLVTLMPEDREVMGFAIQRLAVNLGVTLGPLVGLILIRFSYELLFYADAFTSLVFGLMAAALLPRGVSQAKADVESDSRSGYVMVLRDGRFILFLLATLLMGLVYVQYVSALPLHIRAAGYPVAVYAALVSLNALMVICCEVPITSFVQRLATRLVVALGIGLIGLGVGLYGVLPGLVGLVIATVVWSLGEMVSAPAMTAYPAKLAPPQLRGRYVAASDVPHQVGFALGPVIWIAAWTRLGAGVWVLCALVAVAAVACAVAGVEGRKKPEAAASTAGRA